MKRNALLYIKIAVVLVISGGLALFAVLPLLTSVKNSQLNIHQKNVDLEKTKLVQSDFTSLSRQYEEIQENAQGLEQAFVAKKTSTILETIEHIEGIATTHHITQTLTIDPIPEADDTTTLKSSIKITADGTPDAIFKFLKDIEDLPYYIDFTSFDVNKQSDGSSFATLQGDIFWL